MSSGSGGGVTKVGGVEVDINVNATGAEAGAARAAAALDKLEAKSIAAQAKLTKAADALAAAQVVAAEKGATATEKGAARLQTSLDKAQARVDKAAEGFKQAGLKLAAAQEQAMARAAAATDKGAEEVAASVDKLAAKTAAAGQSVAGSLTKMEASMKASMSKMNSDMNSFGSSAKFQQVGQMLANVSRKMQEGLASALRPAEEFDSRMRYVNTSLGLSEEKFKEFSQQVQDLSSSMTSNSADSAKMAEGLYVIVGAGFEGARALATLKESTKLAQAGMTDIKSSADLLTTVMISYRLGAEKASVASDILSAAVAKGKVTFSEMNASIGPASVKFSKYGVSLEEMSAAFVVLTQNGIKAAEASTILERTITSLVAPTEKQIVSMDKARISYGRAAVAGGKFGESMTQLVALSATDSEIRKMVGSSEALTGVLALASESGKQFKDNLYLMQHAMGSTDAMNTQMSLSFDEKFKMMKKDFDNAAISMKESLLPAMADVAEKGRAVIKMFTDLSPEAKKWVLTGAVVATGLATLAGGVFLFAAQLAALPVLFEGVGVAMGVFAASAGGPIVAAAVALAAGWALNFGGMRDATRSILDEMSAIISGWTPPVPGGRHQGFFDSQMRAGKSGASSSGPYLPFQSSGGGGGGGLSVSDDNFLSQQQQMGNWGQADTVASAAKLKAEYEAKQATAASPNSNSSAWAQARPSNWFSADKNAGSDTRVNQSAFEKANRDLADDERDMDMLGEVLEQYYKSVSKVSSATSKHLKKTRDEMLAYINSGSQYVKDYDKSGMAGLDDPTLTSAYKLAQNANTAQTNIDFTSGYRSNSSTNHGARKAFDAQLSGHGGFGDSGAASTFMPLLAGTGLNGIDEYNYPTAGATAGHMHLTTGNESTKGSFKSFGGSMEGEILKLQGEQDKWMATVEAYIGHSADTFANQRQKADSDYKKASTAAEKAGAGQDTLDSLQARHLAALAEIDEKETAMNFRQRDEKSKIIAELTLLTLDADGKISSTGQERADKDYRKSLARIDELVKKGQGNPQVNQAGNASMAAFARLGAALTHDTAGDEATKKEEADKIKEAIETADKKAKIMLADLEFDIKIGRTSKAAAFIKEQEILNNFTGSIAEQRSMQLKLVEGFKADLQAQLEAQGGYNLENVAKEKARLEAIHELSKVQQAQLAAIKTAEVELEDNAAKERAATMQQFLSVGENGLATFMTSVISGQESFSAAFKNMWKSISATVVAEISKMIAKMLAYRALMFITGLFTGGIGSVASSIGGSIGGLAGGVGSIGSSVLGGGLSIGHTGGSVTSGGIIPSFHSGGQVGSITDRLKPDEIIAKLQTGEHVLSRSQTAAMSGGGGGRVQTNNVTHHNYISATLANSYDVQRMAEDLGRQQDRQMMGLA